MTATVSNITPEGIDDMRGKWRANPAMPAYQRLVFDGICDLALEALAARKPVAWDYDKLADAVRFDLLVAHFNGKLSQAEIDGIGLTLRKSLAARLGPVAQPALRAPGEGVEPVSDEEAGWAFRETLVPRADMRHGPGAAPMWFGWAIMDAFLAGAKHARATTSPDAEVTRLRAEIEALPRYVHGYSNRDGITLRTLDPAPLGDLLKREDVLAALSNSGGK